MFDDFIKCAHFKLTYKYLNNQAAGGAQWPGGTSQSF